MNTFIVFDALVWCLICGIQKLFSLFITGSSICRNEIVRC